MYRDSRLGILLKGLSRGLFDREVARYQADKYNKGFRCWDQFVVMVYAQLSGCRSLRELEAGFNTHTRHHYHLGSREVKRSTLAEANSKRPAQVFAGLCEQLISSAHRRVKSEIKELLYLIDSTPIQLKGRGFDCWCSANATHRNQGLKVHMMFAPGLAVPVHAHITAPNSNDVQTVDKFTLEAGATYVFDKGYCDYNWWNTLDESNCTFVTRFKKNAGVETFKQRSIPLSDQDSVLHDDLVQFKNKRPGGQRINHYYGKPLRRIVIHRPDKPTPLVLATNDMDRSAQEIARLYQQRWEIELFFKWLKQNLKIKTFLGRSENAVKIQIYTALISYLLITAYRQKHGITTSMMLCLTIFRSGLFQRPEIDNLIQIKQQRRRKALLSSQHSLALT